jgi:aspartate aminotransferase
LVSQRAVHINQDTPHYAVPLANRIPIDTYPATMMDIPQSRMFLIADALNAYRQKHGQDAITYDASQGDGGKSLPGVPRHILEHAAEIQISQGTAYNQPWGTPLFRKTAYENYWQIESTSGWTPENIAFVQGGRDGLQKAYNAMINLGNQEIGDALVVSRVPWISYNWGPYAVGLNVLLAPGDPAQGWRYTPEAIKACADYAQQEGRKVAGIVITSPDNPTGRTIPLEEQISLAQTALDSGYPFVLFDWIYHWVTDHGPSDINVVLKAFSAQDRERLIFLDGLTKSLGASNIRSAHLLAGKAVIKHITNLASHGVTPSFYAQAVAIAAYEMSFAQAAASIIQPTSESRKVLRQALESSGIPFIMGDGYYAFIDCTRFIEAGGLANSEELLTHLGENFGVAVVPGMYFSDAGLNWIRFSYATPPDYTEAAIRRVFDGLDALL